MPAMTLNNIDLVQYAETLRLRMRFKMQDEFRQLSLGTVLNYDKITFMLDTKLPESMKELIGRHYAGHIAD